jgi:hypothetical protein
VKRFVGPIAAAFLHGSCIVLVGMLLVAAGQPIFTDDVWWHLAMGRSYLALGPWLDVDPMLHTAAGPAAPAAWMADIGLFGVEWLFGFQGLRLLHVLAVAAIMALAWLLLRRVSRSARYASFATGLLVVLAAYRLFQLRPDLASVLASLLLIRLLVVDPDPPSRRRVAAAVVLMALWANLHGAFLLGPLILGSAWAGLVLASFSSDVSRRAWAELQGRRARRLFTALVLGSLATLINPMGIAAHTLFFVAGGDTPDLAVVVDEWAPVSLFRLPDTVLPPTPAAWFVVWGLVLTMLALVIDVARRRRSSGASPAFDRGFDPALLAVGVVGLIGAVATVRLMWMGLLPLLTLGQLGSHRGLFEGRHASRLTAVGSSLALASLLAFHQIGDWRMISSAVHSAWYPRAFAATKYHAHAVWFMRDAGLEGRLFNDYWIGNFLGYWLAPQLQAFVNGSLNVPKDVMEARLSIMNRQGIAGGMGFEALLDRYDIDVFLGTRVPRMPHSVRAPVHTTTHLEGAEAWLLVFRSMDSAVFLRADERNQHNLDRIMSYYLAEGIPFDPLRGFDLARVIADAPEWAVAHGVRPVNYEEMIVASRNMDPMYRSRGRNALAAYFVTVGLYDKAVTLDRRTLKSQGGALPAARRLVWALLHLRRLEEAALASDTLESLAPPQDELSSWIIDAARRAPELDAHQLDTLVTTLPVFTRVQGARVLSGFREPDVRSSPWRGARPIR